MGWLKRVILGLRELWGGRPDGPVQHWREWRMLMYASLAMLVMGAGWGLYFSLRGNWILVGLDLVMVGAGVGVATLARRHAYHHAAVVLFSSLISLICVIALVFDVPSPRTWRSSHLYLLPLAVAALMAFRAAGFWWRHGVAVVCLLSFGLLSVTDYAPLPQFALPESVRAVGTWVQSTAALAMLYIMLYVLQQDAIGRSAFESDLREGIAQEQFLIHYQPQVDAQQRVVGCEALLRWQHPKRGLVPPGQFIGAAEQSGLILPIGHWVLETACAQLQCWARQPAMQQVRVAVNISQLQFRQVNFVAQVLGMIERYGIEANLLELELTESMLAENLVDIVEKMGALRARGVRFSLDDFGTGYSSLSYLKKMPLNHLKIDQSFVRDILTDASDASIARTVVSLGHNLGLTVIAEGVESQAQRAFLLECGCDLFQGYLFSKPLPVDAFERFVQAQAPVL